MPVHPYIACTENEIALPICATIAQDRALVGHVEGCYHLARELAAGGGAIGGGAQAKALERSQQHAAEVHRATACAGSSNWPAKSCPATSSDCTRGLSASVQLRRDRAASQRSARQFLPVCFKIVSMGGRQVSHVNSVLLSLWILSEEQASGYVHTARCHVRFACIGTCRLLRLFGA